MAVSLEFGEYLLIDYHISRTVLHIKEKGNKSIWAECLEIRPLKIITNFFDGSTTC